MSSSYPLPKEQLTYYRDKEVAIVLMRCLSHRTFINTKNLCFMVILDLLCRVSRDVEFLCHLAYVGAS